MNLPIRLVPVGVNDQNPPINTDTTEETQDKHHIYLCTYNVRSLMSPQRMLLLREALKNIKHDIIGLSEVRMMGNTISEDDEYIFCHTGEVQGKYGVGFLIKRKHKNSIQNYMGLSDRVCILNLKFNETEYSIIQAYAPTTEAQDEDMEKFYGQLRNAQELAYKNTIYDYIAF